jgi:hypothetical protein
VSRSKIVLDMNVVVSGLFFGGYPGKILSAWHDRHVTPCNVGHAILFIGWHGWACYLSVGNVLVNLYPILLQRYTRGRLQAALRRRP